MINWLIKIILIFRLLSTDSVSALLAQIVDYPNVTLPECGVGRESSLVGDDSCYEFNKGIGMHSIRDGRPVSSGEMPFAVYFSIVRDVGWLLPKSCSGVILNDYWLLSAGHCFRDEQRGPIKQTTVQVGLRDVDKPTNATITSRFVYHYFVHELYQQGFDENDKYKQSHYDIALVLMGRPLGIAANSSDPFTDVNGVCLPKANISYANTRGEYAVFSGYGQISDEFTSRRDGRLRMGWNVISNKSELDIIYMDYNDSDRSRPVVCNGDSGGPLVQYVGGRAVLIGLGMAFDQDKWVPSERCPNFGTYGLNFTSVPSKIDWILATIANAYKVLAEENITLPVPESDWVGARRRSLRLNE